MTEIEKHPTILVVNTIMITIGILFLASIFTHTYQPQKQIKQKPVDRTKTIRTR